MHNRKAESRMMDFEEWFDEYMKHCPNGTENSMGHRWVERQWMTEHRLWTDRCAKCGWRRIWDVSGETLILDKSGVWITGMPSINKLACAGFRSSTARFSPEPKHSVATVEDEKPKRTQPHTIRIPQIL